MLRRIAPERVPTTCNAGALPTSLPFALHSSSWLAEIVWANDIFDKQKKCKRRLQPLPPFRKEQRLEPSLTRDVTLLARRFVYSQLLRSFRFLFALAKESHDD